MAATKYRFCIPELFHKHKIANAYQVQKAMNKPPAAAGRLIDPDRTRISIETVNELCEFFKCKPGDLFVADQKPARKQGRK